MAGLVWYHCVTGFGHFLEYDKTPQLVAVPRFKSSCVSDSIVLIYTIPDLGNGVAGNWPCCCLACPAQAVKAKLPFYVFLLSPFVFRAKALETISPFFFLPSSP